MVINKFTIIDDFEISGMGVCLLSHIWLFATPWIVAHQAPLSVQWDFIGKNTGAGCHLLLQGLFLTQGQNPHPLHLLH